MNASKHIMEREEEGGIGLALFHSTVGGRYRLVLNLVRNKDGYGSPLYRFCGTRMSMSRSVLRAP